MFSQAERAETMHTHLRTLVVVTIAVAVGLVPTDAQAQGSLPQVGSPSHRLVTAYSPERLDQGAVVSWHVFSSSKTNRRIG